jgi:stage IV sporulation protein A
MRHPIKNSIFSHVRQTAGSLSHVREVGKALAALETLEEISQAKMRSVDLGKGIARITLDLPRELFYLTLSNQSGFSVKDDGDLMSLLRTLADVKRSYDKVASALDQVYTDGYGIVMPGIDELILAEPEIMRQGGRYGVRLKANAPSIHMFKVDIESTVSPIVGNEKQSEDMVHYLLEKYQGDTAKIWESNIFGRSFHELVNEDLQAKLQRIPEDARKKFRETLQKIVNEGGGGLICIIL